MSEKNPRTDLCKCETSCHMELCHWVQCLNCGVETWRGWLLGWLYFLKGLLYQLTISTVASTVQKKTDLHSLLDCTLPSSKKLASSGKVSSEECQCSNILSSSFHPCTSLPITAPLHHCSIHSHLPFAKCGSRKVWSTEHRDENK